MFGEITPAYAMLDPQEFRFIRAEFPNIKIVHLMRNPADRLWSQMRFSEKYTTGPELESRVDAILSNPKYMKRADYSRTIQNLRGIFTENEVHHIFYENLFTEAAIVQLCRFLEISPRAAQYTRKHNVSAPVNLSLQTRSRMVAALRGQYEFAIQEFGDQVPQNWLNDLV